MLSDDDRRALVELEGRLLADDPSWAMAFDAAGRSVSRRRAFALAVHIVTMTAFTALTGLMLVAHAPGPALFFGSVAGLLIWLTRRLRRTAGARGPRPGTDDSGPSPS